MLLVPSSIRFSGYLLYKFPVSKGFGDKGPIFNLNMNMKKTSLNHLLCASSVPMSISRNSSLPV